jgi:hypothetical protein
VNSEFTGWFDNSEKGDVLANLDTGDIFNYSYSDQTSLLGLGGVPVLRLKAKEMLTALWSMGNVPIRRSQR